MLRRFFLGIMFGSGFAFALLVVLYVGISFFIISNNHTVNGFSVLSSEGVPNTFEASKTKNGVNRKHNLKIPFHELSLEDQITNSSVIAIATYEPGADGKVKAVISDILKKDKGTTFYYGIGDEYHDASYYPSEGRSYGDGVVIFFVGSPAQMRMASSYRGDRIGSLGDLPIKLLRKKCKAPSA